MIYNAKDYGFVRVIDHVIIQDVIHQMQRICYKVRTRGPLVFEVGYHPRKKIHIIRVVFQDQAMYTRTSFRGAKTCKIGKKGCVFGHVDKFWKGHDGQIKKNACKNVYLGSV